MMALQEKPVGRKKRAYNKDRHWVIYIPAEKEAEYEAFFAKNPFIPKSQLVRRLLDLGIELAMKKGLDPTTLRPMGM
jgi:hypothetical protein